MFVNHPSVTHHKMRGLGGLNFCLSRRHHLYRISTNHASDQLADSNASCAGNPSAFTNGSANISGLTSNAVNGVQPSCLVVDAAVAASPTLTLTKTASVASAAQNGSFTYTVSVNNSGSGASAANTVITDFLPADVSITGLTNGAGWSCSPSTAVGPARISCTKATGVAAGANETVMTLNATKTSTTSVTNIVAVINGDATCAVAGPPARCRSQAVVDASIVPGLSLTKSAGAATTALGATPSKSDVGDTIT